MATKARVVRRLERARLRLTFDADAVGTALLSSEKCAGAAGAAGDGAAGAAGAA